MTDYDSGKAGVLAGTAALVAHEMLGLSYMVCRRARLFIPSHYFKFMLGHR